MNDTIDTENNNTNGGLTGSFGDRGLNVNAMGYGHPHGDKIIAEAKEIIRESHTGNRLLALLDKKVVPINVIKGKGETGFSPDMGTILMQIPSGVKTVPPEHVLRLIKALHEAAQELAGNKAPNIKDDIMAYASFIHGRNLDSLYEVCKVVKELTESSSFPVLLDSLDKIGLNKFYKGFTEGKSRDELFDEYAEAYETL